jgi:hypothetical protein
MLKRVVCQPLCVKRTFQINKGHILKFEYMFLSYTMFSGVDIIWVMYCFFSSN